jgi:catechol 2,3-dioxygenase-like lactoylglutathione lyase family enzyme
MLRAARATATIPVDDLPRAKAFYEDTLKLDVVLEGEGFALLAAGEETLVILYQPVPDSGPDRTLAAFTLNGSDLASVVSELDARGVHFEDYDLPGFKTDGHIVEDPNGMRSAFFRDSEGNILAIDSIPDELRTELERKTRS